MKLGIFAVACALALACCPRPGGTESVPPPRAANGRQDVDAAVRFRARADAGDAAAQYELAHLQFIGLAPQRQAGETLRLLTSAAVAGHDQAQLLLARVREFGFDGAPPDLAQALKWYGRAAATSSTPDLRKAAAEACARLHPQVSASLIAAAEEVAPPL